MSPLCVPAARDLLLVCQNGYGGVGSTHTVARTSARRAVRVFTRPVSGLTSGLRPAAAPSHEHSRSVAVAPCYTTGLGLLLDHRCGGSAGFFTGFPSPELCHSGLPGNAATIGSGARCVKLSCTFTCRDPRSRVPAMRIPLRSAPADPRSSPVPCTPRCRRSCASWRAILCRSGSSAVDRRPRPS